MKALGAVCCLSLIGCVYAPDRVMITAASHHAIAAPGETFNPVNPGAIFTWEGDVDLSAGAFINSYGKPSVATFASLDFFSAWGAQVSAFAGAAHYPEDGRRFAISVGDIVPLVGVQIWYENFAINILPSDCVATCAILLAGFSFDL